MPSGLVIVQVAAHGCGTRLGIMVVMAGMTHGIMVHGMDIAVGIVLTITAGMILGSMAGTTPGTDLTTVTTDGAGLIIATVVMLIIMVAVMVAVTTTDVQATLVLST